MKIIICGGRDFNDYILMEEIFEQVSSQNNFKNIEIVCGMAKSAAFYIQYLEKLELLK